MTGRVMAAMRCLDELKGIPTMEACHAAAILAGVSLIDAEECDDGACCCPRCPWKRTAANWHARQVDAADLLSRAVR